MLTLNISACAGRQVKNLLNRCTVILLIFMVSSAFGLSRFADDDNLDANREMQCDCCRAIAHKMKMALDDAVLAHRGRKLKEAEVHQALVNVCTTSFDDYEVKEVEDLNRLTGPGLNTGGRRGPTYKSQEWIVYMRDRCKKYIMEIGDMKIYEPYQKDSNEVKYFLCFGEGVRSDCIDPNHRIDHLFKENSFMYDDMFHSTDELR